MPDKTAAAGKRPVGATIISLLMGWTAIGSIANAFIWWSIPPELLEKAPELKQVVDELNSSALLRVSILISGIAGLAASVGIWRMKSWMQTTTMMIAARTR